MWCDGDCAYSFCKNVNVGVSTTRACSVNEAARLLVFACLCVCILVYLCVHTSHLHGAMPHRFHWGVWEQRLSISSAAVPAGRSLIIISWMMSLRHAPRSRPVAASLQHLPVSLSIWLLLLFQAFPFYSLSLACAAFCSPSFFPSHSFIPWIWPTRFSLSVFSFLFSLSLVLLLCCIFHLLWSWRK